MKLGTALKSLFFSLRASELTYTLVKEGKADSTVTITHVAFLL